TLSSPRPPLSPLLRRLSPIQIQPKRPSSAAAATTSRPAPRGGRAGAPRRAEPHLAAVVGRRAHRVPAPPPRRGLSQPSLSNPNPLPPSDLNTPPPLSLPPRSPIQSAAVLYPDPSPLRRARHEPSAGGSAAGAARASPPRAMSPPSTIAPPPPPSRPPSRAPPEQPRQGRPGSGPGRGHHGGSRQGRPLRRSGRHRHRHRQVRGSSKPRQAARGGGCDVGKSLDYLYRACRIATLAVLSVHFATSRSPASKVSIHFDAGHLQMFRSPLPLPSTLFPCASPTEIWHRGAPF
uniref:Uncharacterized protein n=1 Tax=Aegilops tauschii subsp. strangulata TaxID=200361 RepID=A0A452ZC21_AEGTS